MKLALSSRYAKMGMIAFIDLLGYGDRVVAIQSEADLRSIEADVRKVQRWFEHRTVDDAMHETHKFNGKKVLAFSDCLVIVVPSVSELARFEGDFDIQLSEISALAIAQGMCVINGIFIRGGIDYSLWYKRRDTIISPGLVKSYRLESTSVKVPMVEISDDLLAHFSNHAHRQFYHEDFDPVQRYFRKFLLPDGKEHWLLDYLPICLDSIDGALTSEERAKYPELSADERDALRNRAFERGIRETIEIHREKIVEARNLAPNEAVRQKFDWLAKYHNETITRIFASTVPDALMINLEE